MTGTSRLAFRGALTWLIVIVVLAGTIRLLPLPDPLAVDLTSIAAPPSLTHLAGTDELGRDVLSRVLHAAGATLEVVAGATVLSLGIALVLGTAAGFVGGWPDIVVRLGIDLLWSVPFVVFVVLIVGLLGVSKITLILTIGVLNWVGPARVLRAEVAHLRNADFVVAARARGYPPHLILSEEILPNLRRTILTLAAYTSIEVLTLETGLAFVGLSLPAPTPTWGGMLADGLSYFSSAWWIVISTSAIVTLTLASLQIAARSVERQTS